MSQISRKRMFSEEMDTSTPKEQGLSPNSKLKVFKLEAHLCNNKPIHKNVELSDDDVEKIWTTSLNRDWIEIDGFKQRKVTYKKQERGCKNHHPLRALYRRTSQRHR